MNVYCSVHGDRVHFLDMEGRHLHTLALADTGEGADCMVEPYGARSFLALAWPTLTLLDFDSRVVWRSEEGGYRRGVRRINAPASRPCGPGRRGRSGSR